MMQNHRITYKEEATELLAELEGSLLELEENPKDSEIIGRVFRCLHTIKGSGAMFGFDDIASFTHEVETTFDLIREGKIAVTGDLIGLTLSSCDYIRTLLESSDGGVAPDKQQGESLIASLKKLTGNIADSLPVGSSDGIEEPEKKASDNPEAFEVSYRIRFRPERNLLTTGFNPILLLNELRELGPCKVVAQTNEIPPLDEIDPEECYTYWDVVLTTNHGTNAIKDLFIFIEDVCALTVDVIDDGDGEDAQEAPEVRLPNHKRLGEILVEKGDLTPDDINGALSAQKPIGQLLMEAGVVDPGLIESACAEQEHIKELRRSRQANDTISTVRVPADRLDTLVNLVGELVTVQARLSQMAAFQNQPEISSIAEEVERLTEDLRDNVMNIRMVPIGTTFNKFKRVVRDLAEELGKNIVLETVGAETELDKTVIERLNDPLIHLIRNSIDHGIEAPDIREAAGKPRQGIVSISAAHSGAFVLIRIADDGAGLNKEAVRAKAVAKGLISPDVEFSEKDAFALIFTPGFSTAEKLTSISGRGVGMDVVKRNIEALRGSIEIESWEGAGTVITLKLPLTLAIIDGLLVKVGEGQFVIPLSVVQECVELTPLDKARSNGRDLAHVRGEIVPYIRLRERFLIEGQVPGIEQIIITGACTGRVGLVVDQVIGERQTVIKNLGKLFRHVEDISGATILGDGKLALILDVPKLVEAEVAVAQGTYIH
ncbi:MAG: chemotaxis protein CheA [Syntrophobacteraceae bacterium]